MKHFVINVLSGKISYYYSLQYYTKYYCEYILVKLIDSELTSPVIDFLLTLNTLALYTQPCEIFKTPNVQ